MGQMGLMGQVMPHRLIFDCECATSVVFAKSVSVFEGFLKDFGVNATAHSDYARKHLRQNASKGRENVTDLRHTTLVALLPMQAFGTARQAAKPLRITAVGKRVLSGASAAHGRAALKFFCALPWSEAERQGASMVISRRVFWNQNHQRP